MWRGGLFFFFTFCFVYKTIVELGEYNILTYICDVDVDDDDDTFMQIQKIL